MTLERPISTVFTENDAYRESEDEDYNDQGMQSLIFFFFCKLVYVTNNHYTTEGDYNSDSDSESEKNTKTNATNPSPDGAFDGEKEELNLSSYDKIQGDGGLIKTRAQRQLEIQKEKDFKLNEKLNGSTIDVDSVWASMNAEKSVSPAASTPEQPSAPISKQQKAALEDEYITIKRVYNFAGNVTTEEKKVLASSAEGMAYIKEQNTQPQLESNDKKRSLESTDAVSALKPRRGPLVKRRKSKMLDELAQGKAKKLNTLEKSKLDWLGYVDQQGIKDDLSQHNKDGYLQKQDFLQRVERRIDNDLKQFKRK